MKNLMLTLVLSVAVAAAGVAQIAKGTIGLGGSAHFNRDVETSGSEDSQYKQVTREYGISPQMGLFVSDNLEVGVGLGYEVSQSEEELSDVEFTENPGERYTDVSVQPFIRWYKMLDEKFGFTFLAAGEIGSRKGNWKLPAWSDVSQEDAPIPVDEHKFEENFWSVHLAPGIVFFPVRKVAFTVEFGYIGYRSESFKTSPDVPGERLETKLFEASLFPDWIDIGIEYYFRK